MTAADLAARIVRAYMQPAAAMTGAEWRERWKKVNRAAGAIAATSLMAYLTPAAAVSEAQRMTDEVQGLFLRSDGSATSERKMLMDGLRKRVAECLVEMGA